MSKLRARTSRLVHQNQHTGRLHRFACVKSCGLATGLGLIIAPGLGVLGGCASGDQRDASIVRTPEPGIIDATAVVIENRDGAAVFAAARDVLLESGFRIDRFDARSGVLTTHPARTAGLAAPWIEPRTTLEQAAFDTISPIERTARIDLDESSDGSVRVAVTVTLGRIHRPGLRIETESISQSRINVDPTHYARGMAPESVEVLERDDRLAAKMLGAIVSRLERTQPE
jgi:hypothetical protein